MSGSGVTSSPGGTIKPSCCSSYLIYYILINNGKESHYFQIKLVPEVTQVGLNPLGSLAITRLRDR